MVCISHTRWNAYYVKFGVIRGGPYEGDAAIVQMSYLY